jgi:hypothetical protein
VAGLRNLDSDYARYSKDASIILIVLYVFRHQTNIRCWNQVKVLLAGERKICNQIFDGITFNKDQCFAEVTGSSVMTLLSFGDVIAKSKRSHENLFVLLEMYGLMHGLRSEVCRDNAFSTSHRKDHVFVSSQGYCCR